MDPKEIAVVSSNKSLQSFIHQFPCLPAPSRPNTSPNFNVVDASRPVLRDSPSPFHPSAWVELLRQYPGPLGIHLSMILRFGAEVGYQGPQDAFILSKNLTSSREDPLIIDTKLEDDLRMHRVIPVINPLHGAVKKLACPRLPIPIGGVPSRAREPCTCSRCIVKGRSLNGKKHVCHPEGHHTRCGYCSKKHGTCLEVSPVLRLSPLANSSDPTIHVGTNHKLRKRDRERLDKRRYGVN